MYCLLSARLRLAAIPERPLTPTRLYLIAGRLEFLESPTLKAASVRATPQPHHASVRLPPPPHYTPPSTPETSVRPPLPPTLTPTPKPHTHPNPQRTQWIRVVPSASAKRLVKMIDHYWRLPKPEVLITVTGGAQDLPRSRS